MAVNKKLNLFFTTAKFGIYVRLHTGYLHSRVVYFYQHTCTS